MKHSFNINIAKEVGIESAIILDNINFWLAKNKANSSNLHEGRYWTYNSVKAFSELFPYMTVYKISRCLNDLEEKGLLLSGNFNKSNYDRTKWYTINEANELVKQFLHYSKVEASSSSKSKMEFANTSNGVCKSEQPIPDSKPYINTDVNKEEEEERISLPLEISKSDLYKQQSEAQKKEKNVPPKKETWDSVFEWLEINAPMALESFEMKFKRQIPDWNMFKERFNNKADEEEISYSKRAIMGRLNNFALTWVSYAKKDKEKNRPKYNEWDDRPLNINR